MKTQRQVYLLNLPIVVWSACHFSSRAAYKRYLVEERNSGELAVSWHCPSLLGLQGAGRRLHSSEWEGGEQRSSTCDQSARRLLLQCWCWQVIHLRSMDPVSASATVDNYHLHLSRNQTGSLNSLENQVNMHFHCIFVLVAPPNSHLADPLV